MRSPGTSAVLVAGLVAGLGAGACGGSGKGAGMEIVGSVDGAGAGLPALALALLWPTEAGPGGCDPRVNGLVRVPVEGALPGPFRITVTDPPPDHAFGFQAPVAEAYLAAVDAEDRAHGWAATPGKVVYKLFFARRAIAAGSPESERYGGTALAAGYQLGWWDRSGSTGSRVVLVGPEAQVQISLLDSPSAPIASACIERPGPGVPPGGAATPGN